MPRIEAPTRMTLTAEDPWFRGGIRLNSLDGLRAALVETKKWVPLGTVYRGFSNLTTQLMGRPRTHVHSDERWDLLVKRRGIS